MSIYRNNERERERECVCIAMLLLIRVGLYFSSKKKSGYVNINKMESGQVCLVFFFFDQSVFGLRGGIWVFLEFQNI